MTGRPMIGILLALVVESAHWLKFRWDFDEQDCSRAWQLTTIALSLAALLIYLDSSLISALPILLTWLPPLLLPMQFVQSFGLKDSLPVNTFSFLAKQRRRRNLRLGLSESVIHINFGNIYFVTTLVGCTMGSEANGWPFLPGVIILTGWMMFSTTRSHPVALLMALLFAGGLAIAGERGLDQLQAWLGNRASGRSSFDPNTVYTMIGKPGTVTLSPDIVWRLRPLPNSPAPTLLRTATYNHYNPSSWDCQPLVDKKFKDLDSKLYENVPYFILTPGAAENDQIKAMSKSLPQFSLRGSAFAETPLALPGDSTSLRDFELDGIERNSFGTVRVFPKQSVIEGTVLWKGDSSPDNPPIFEADMNVPIPEREVLQAILKELQVDARPTLKEKLATIRAWLLGNFQYTRNLTISSPAYVFTKPTAMTQFLTKTRAGHCEYFATATVLLLREAGIPARYATGYALMERDVKRKEFVIRGTHGHAWCRVWDATSNKWIDFDTTPGNWFASLPPQNSMMQRFNDAVKRIREDFFLWRNRPNNRLAVTFVMSAIGLGVVGFVVKRLWKTKRRLEAEKFAAGYGGPLIRTPLHALERQAEKRLGMRPPGQPFGAWLSRLGHSLADSKTLDEAIELHQRLRFDPAPSQLTEQRRLEELAKQLESEIKRS
jgi:hypothetical protein